MRGTDRSLSTFDMSVGYCDGFRIIYSHLAYEELSFGC